MNSLVYLTFDLSQVEKIATFHSFNEQTNGIGPVEKIGIYLNTVCVFPEKKTVVLQKYYTCTTQK